MKRILTKLNKKLNNDYKKYIKDLQRLNKKALINQAYSIATINNFYDALTYYIEDECEDFPISEKLIKKLLDYEENILIYFEKIWINYSHPEYYNFWYDFSAVIEIIEYAICQLKEN